MAGNTVNRAEQRGNRWRIAVWGTDTRRITLAYAEIIEMEDPRAEVESRPLDRPFVSEKPKLRKLIASQNLTGLANDTKWNELIQSMRSDSSKDWCPGYRFNCIDSDYISDWDCEWWYHLPFPFMSVRWIEILYIEKKDGKGILLPLEVVDHSDRFITLLKKIGLDFKKGTDAIRVFGYAPRDLTDFAPLKNTEAYQGASDNADKPRV